MYLIKLRKKKITNTVDREDLLTVVSYLLDIWFSEAVRGSSADDEYLNADRILKPIMKKYNISVLDMLKEIGCGEIEGSYLEELHRSFGKEL